MIPLTPDCSTESPKPNKRGRPRVRPQRVKRPIDQVATIRAFLLEMALECAKQCTDDTPPANVIEERYKQGLLVGTHRQLRMLKYLYIRAAKARVIPDQHEIVTVEGVLTQC